MNKLKLKTLISTLLLSSVCSVVTAQGYGDHKGAKYFGAEATAEELKLSFRDLTKLNKGYINTAPAKRKDGILVSSLEAEGYDKDIFIKLGKEIAEQKYGNYDSLLIAHKGKLLFESYYLRGRVNFPHPQASAVKAYTSLVLGRAIEMGYLTMADLNKPLVNFLKKIDQTKLAKGVDKITLHKALTMQGGLNVDPEKWKEIEKKPKQLQGQGLAQALFEHSAPITEESQIYKYGNHNPILVMSVIDAVVPGTAKDFIKKEVLDKLGITNYKWETHLSGLPQAGWMASITSRDILKLGNMVLNNGKWNGEQLISADYLAKATSGIVKPTQDWMPKRYRYGYFWYQAPIVVGDKSYNATSAWGGGDQRVIVIDELDLTIAFTGYGRDSTLIEQIQNTVVPAFAK